MKKTFMFLFAVLAFVACRNDKDTPSPEATVEDRDWYILRGPQNRDVYALHGDIDGTLLVTDRFRIHYTQDQGKTWTEADYQSHIGLAGFAVRNDTLFALDTETTTSTDPGNRFAVRPYYFSIDGGIHWKELPNRWLTEDIRVSLNYAHSGNGIRFSIDEVVHPSGMVDHIGIKSENGRKIGLPQRHVLNNVHFDGKSRLYVAASAPFCQKDGYLSVCDKNDYRGTLYVSKKAIEY